MNKVAIVVQRCHPSVVGGSEAMAQHYADLLREIYEVDVLTSTAVDCQVWANSLPPGVNSANGITYRRFPVTIGRPAYWESLHGRLLRDYPCPASGSASASAAAGARPRHWTLAQQEEWIRFQGPYCPDLSRYLEQHWCDYRAILFVTYLYATTYFGLQMVPTERALLAPTLHEESPALLPAYRRLAQRVKRVCWLSEAERRLGERLWGQLPSAALGMAVETNLATPAARQRPYLLYCGRIAAVKGCAELLEHFLAYKRQHPSALQLVLTGDDELGLPSHPDIDYRGFVSATEKFALMAGACAFVMPSRFESFSIATLEAMGQGTPVLVNSGCAVLTDHVRNSGGGLEYLDQQSFFAALNEFLDQKCGSVMGKGGRDYVLARFQRDKVMQALQAAVEDDPKQRAA